MEQKVLENLEILSSGNEKDLKVFVNAIILEKKIEFLGTYMYTMYIGI